MSTKQSLDKLFSTLILRHLERYASIPEKLIYIVYQALIRLIDSKIIIEDPLISFSDLSESKIEQTLPIVNNDVFIESLIRKIRYEGFGMNFHQLTAQLGAIMIQFCGNEQQQKEVLRWGQGVFLMTDKGGANLTSWLSESIQEKDGLISLKINKIWAIEAHKAKFCIVNVKKKSMMAPLAFFISPDKYQTLNKSPIGLKFLDNYVQLGNVEGSVIVTKNDQLSAGGIVGVNRFLALARPRFILSVMAHLQWLIEKDRLYIDKDYYQVIETINLIASKIISKNIFNRYSIEEVLALKLTSNEILLDLVLNNAVPSIFDQRDLLALGKMEGSSYRCMHELYMRTKRAVD